MIASVTDGGIFCKVVMLVDMKTPYASLSARIEKSGCYKLP